MADRKDLIMRLDLKNSVHRQIFIYSMSLIIAILFYLLLARINVIFDACGKLLSYLTPFLLGFGLAFILNGPVLWMENRLYSICPSPKTRKALAAAIVFLLFFLFLFFTLSIIIPSLIDSVKVFLENAAGYISRLDEILEKLSVNFDIDLGALQSYLSRIDLVNTVTNYLKTSLGSMMSYSYSIVHGLTNIVIAFAAAFYMIMDKKQLLHLLKSLTFSLLGKDRANFLILYMMDARNVFQQYIVGNILDSFIVGLICWLGCLILRLPYAPMIGLIIGITNIIPVFGPFLGAIPVILLLVLIHPMYGLIFAVFILILQQVDGNVLKPIILGDKLGISGFWILFSVSLGGSLAGVAGMFLGVPIFALIYEAVQDLTSIRLSEKDLVIPEQSGVIQ